MPKQRLHYQKSFLQKSGDFFCGCFTARSTATKRIFIGFLTIIAILALFLVSTYQKTDFIMGKPSPITVKAEKNLITYQQNNKISYNKGQVIINKGEVVSSNTLDALDMQRTLINRSQLKVMLIEFLLAVICYLSLGIYLSIFQRSVFESIRMLSVLSLIIVGTLAISLISKQVSDYFNIVPAAVIAAALLFNPLIALSIGMVTSLLTGLITGNLAGFVISGLLGTVIVVLIIGKRKEVNVAIGTALTLSVSLGALSFVISAVKNFNLIYNLTQSFYGFTSGMASTVLALGMMPFFESIFGITTDSSLLEITKGNKVLLRKLISQAPGTYNHSMNVSCMAESVAPLIGADPLLTKAGGLYHDIGKIRRPYFFIENQMKGESPHDDKKAELSYLIITAHVREGVEIAKKYDLPKEIIDIIKQHHGTTIVQYFYNLAKKTGKDVKEYDYRYHEEIPKSKEAALIMLADSVEAAARSYVKPTEEEIRNMVEGLINQRIKDDQLNESHMSSSDIKIIKEKYSSFLISVYHPRLKYPGKALNTKLKIVK